MNEANDTTKTRITVVLWRQRWEMDGPYEDTRIDEHGRWYREAWSCPTFDTSREWANEKLAKQGVSETVAKLADGGIACDFKVQHSWTSWPEGW